MQDVITVIVACRGGGTTVTIPYDADPRMDAVIADVAGEAVSQAVRSMLNRPRMTTPKE